MPTPRLIHPIPVFIRQIQRSLTAQDDDAHEPVGQARRKQKPIKLMGQIKTFDPTDAPDASSGGVTEHSSGYILFRTHDLKHLRITLQRGDRIVQIGEGKFADEVDYYITQKPRRGHYPEHRGATLQKFFFSDRKPSRQRGDL